MSKRTSLGKDAPVDSTLSRRSVEDSAISKITGREADPSLIPTAGGRGRSSASSIYRRSAEEDAVQALMDLSLPRFTKLDDGVIPKTEPWTVTENSPASPGQQRTDTERIRRHLVRSTSRHSGEGRSTIRHMNRCQGKGRATFQCMDRRQGKSRSTFRRMDRRHGI